MATAEAQFYSQFEGHLMENQVSKDLKVWPVLRI